MSQASLPGQIVYLAGPMSGLPYEDAQAWRDKATKFLQRLRDPRTKDPLYHILNPLRGHDQYKGKEFTPAGGFDDDSAAKADIRRDRYDVLRSHIVLANLTDSEKTKTVSQGTVWEMVWASEHHKFLIVIMKKGNPHWHSFNRDAASILLPNLDEALEYMKDTLNASEVGD